MEEFKASKFFNVEVFGRRVDGLSGGYDVEDVITDIYNHYDEQVCFGKNKIYNMHNYYDRLEFVNKYGEEMMKKFEVYKYVKTSYCNEPEKIAFNVIMKIINSVYTLDYFRNALLDEKEDKELYKWFKIDEIKKLFICRYVIIYTSKYKGDGKVEVIEIDWTIFNDEFIDKWKVNELYYNRDRRDWQTIKELNVGDRLCGYTNGMYIMRVA